jgi:hypothetical protein
MRVPKQSTHDKPRDHEIDHPDADVSRNGKADPITKGSILVPTWPTPLASEAYYGLAGEIVRAIEPESEADPIALLIQLLTAYGNAVGRSPYFRVEGDRHHLNLFAVIVGQTSKARKGTSWGRIQRLLEQIDRELIEKRVLTGLSSGEGLVWNVRDPVMARDKHKDRAGRITVQEYEADPGEIDKRLLIQEPEFANVLKQSERAGNTLSVLLRQAWERGNLRTLVSGRTNPPLKATGAHISIVGHITAEELRRYLSSTEAASGFGNRFLWLCVRRSKCLPEGGKDIDLDPFVRGLTMALQFARNTQEMRRDDVARHLWKQVYPELSEGKPGLAGAVCGRAEAQTMRVACLYALLDASEMVRKEHLLAALALWDYCERSVKFIFGDSLGDPVADEILRALRMAADGLTRTMISRLLGHHQDANRIGRALGLLVDAKVARWEEQQTDGRSSERWFAVRQ